MRELYNCCISGNAEQLEKIITDAWWFQRKTLANAVLDLDGNRALHLVAQFQNNPEQACRMAQLLLKAGADLTIQNKYGYDPLHMTIRQRKKLLFETFLTRNEKGTLIYSPNLTQKGEYDRTLLHTCAFHGFVDILQLFPETTIQLLKEAKTSVDNQQATALHFAAMQGHVATIDWLIEKGADARAQNLLGETPLMTAVIAHQADVVYYFYDKGMGLNVNDESALLNREGLKKIRPHILELLQTVVERQKARLPVMPSITCDAPSSSTNILNEYAETRRQVMDCLNRHTTETTALLESAQALFQMTITVEEEYATEEADHSSIISPS